MPGRNQMRGETNSPDSGGTFRTLPVNLLLKDRLCLLAGAGHVAHRKLRTLLDHGARVVLVAPEVRSEVRALGDLANVEIREGRYAPEILDELRPFLVYAATDDDALNRRIAAEAAERGMLASSVSSWRCGDFISPSVLRWGRGQVSITTEGASCRQAKFMRIRLEELLGGDRELILIGVDVRTIGYEAFERVRPDPERQQALVAMLRHLAALEEFALLSTCNRLELYAWSRIDPSLRHAALTMLGIAGHAEDAYVRTGGAVLTHAADVVAGHRSEIVGETEITAQFKAAFRQAFAAHVAGVHLQNLHDEALRLAKRIRGMHGVAREGLPALVRARMPAGGRVLLLGAGHLGTAVAGALAGSEGLSLTWGNRTLARIPPEPAFERLSLAEALARLGEFDVVICAAGAGRPILRAEHLASLAAPPDVLDLGLPRNVDPAVRDLPGVRLFTLEDFRGADEDRERLFDLTRSMAEVLHG